MFACVAHEVMIASPSDMASARDIVEQSVYEWNVTRAAREAAVVLPLRWEKNVVPMLGYEGGQPVINAQLLEKADILIALFGTKAGTPTAAARSGTLEEIDKALLRGLPVHVYFSKMPLDSDVDTDALNQVRELERELRQRGLTGEFRSYEELQREVHKALEMDMARLSSESIAGFDSGGSLLRVIGQARSTADAAIVITNEGKDRCEGLRVSITSGPTGARLIMGKARFDLKPEEQTRLALLGVKAGDRLRLKLDWREGGLTREETAAVTLATI